MRPVKALALGAGILLLAAAGFVAACGGDAPAAPPPTYTLVPGPTAMAGPGVEIETCHESGYCGVFSVGGGLLAAAWLDDRRMYLADMEGRIRLLDVETGRVETMLEGLVMPRGLTALGGRLYVSELGNTCELIKERTGAGGNDNCNTVFDWQIKLEILSRVNAKILAYGIDDSGALNDRQVVADRIIASSLGMGVNGLVNDGEYVYVSISHPQRRTDPQGPVITHTGELASRGRRTDLMGVIARFRPPYSGESGAEIEVYASGFRNVYGISISPDGTIYAADNDEPGVLAEGHLEELNAVVEGGFYGFPLYGTNQAPPEAGVIEPVAVLEGNGSTYAYANDDGVYVAYSAARDTEKGFAVDLYDYGTWTSRRVFTSDHYATALLERQGLLYVLSLAGNVHVINPSAAPVTIEDSFSNYEYINTIISEDLPSVASQGFDVYLYEGRLIYHKTSCTSADTANRFYLHITPVDPDDLPEDRKRHGFDNIDFPFVPQGQQSGDACWVVRELPEYAIAKIRTGQFIQLEAGFRNIWEAEFDFGR